MKKRWLLFSCLGLVIVVCVVVGIIAYIGFSAFKDVAKQELSRLDAVPQAQRPVSSLGPESQPPGSEIHDLSYIKILAVGYSDNADPNDDGIAIDISFYDSKSELLQFSGVPFNVVIELYGYRDIFDTFEKDNAQLVYRGYLTLDHSMRLGEIMGNYIRIPFEEISVDKGTYTPFGTLSVIVETPKQGEFHGKTDLVPLYPYEE